jgi:hypothetical protein
MDAKALNNEKPLARCVVCGKELVSKYAMGVCNEPGCSNVLCRRHWLENGRRCPEHAMTPEKKAAEMDTLRASGARILSPDQLEAAKATIFSGFDNAVSRAEAIYDPARSEDVSAAALLRWREHVEAVTGAAVFPEAVTYIFSYDKPRKRRTPAPFLRLGVCFCFDAAEMEKNGYVSHPLGQVHLNSTLNRLLQQPRVDEVCSVFCLVSPTDWDADARSHVETGFQHDRLHVCLRGKEATFVARSGDGVSDAFLPIFSPARFLQIRKEIEDFVVQRLADSIGVTVGEVTAARRAISERHVRKVFQSLAENDAYRLDEFPDMGLVISERSS